MAHDRVAEMLLVIDEKEREGINLNKNDLVNMTTVRTYSTVMKYTNLLIELDLISTLRKDNCVYLKLTKKGKKTVEQIRELISIFK